jgi:hypothetical protein
LPGKGLLLRKNGRIPPRQGRSAPKTPEIAWITALPIGLSVIIILVDMDERKTKGERTDER